MAQQSHARRDSAPAIFAVNTTRTTAHRTYNGFGRTRARLSRSEWNLAANRRTSGLQRPDVKCGRGGADLSAALEVRRFPTLGITVPPHIRISIASGVDNDVFVNVPRRDAKDSQNRADGLQRGRIRLGLKSAARRSTAAWSANVTDGFAAERRSWRTRFGQAAPHYGPRR